MSTSEFNTKLFDDVVLALLWFNSSEGKFGGHSAWKSLPWDALDRLHARELISDPRRKNYSVALDDEAWQRGRALFEQWFVAPAPATVSAPAVAPGKAGKHAKAGKPAGTAHQFKITLDYTSPAVWRRIQLPSEATFWDLHCAINDAMGWEDAHLHEFKLGNKRDSQRIGIPEDDSPWGDDALADWDVPIATHFAKRGARCNYLYDFGDGWSHKVELEAIAPREPKTKYPRCLDGARACPPEDCGGPFGYERLCTALADPASVDGDTEELLESFADYDLEAFDPAKVKFHSAARRLKALRGTR
jgi:hypothetical protein